MCFLLKQARLLLGRSKTLPSAPGRAPSGAASDTVLPSGGSVSAESTSNARGTTPEAAWTGGITIGAVVLLFLIRRGFRGVRITV